MPPLHVGSWVFLQRVQQPRLALAKTQHADTTKSMPLPSQASKPYNTVQYNTVKYGTLFPPISCLSNLLRDSYRKTRGVGGTPSFVERIPRAMFLLRGSELQLRHLTLAKFGLQPLRNPAVVLRKRSSLATLNEGKPQDPTCKVGMWGTRGRKG
jgi:hypothetical protein